MSTGLLVTLAAVVILVIWIVFIHNNLVALRNNRENAFANIDVQLSSATTSFHSWWRRSRAMPNTRRNCWRG